MNEGNYKTVKQYLGVELLKYSLNYPENIKWDASATELNLKDIQKYALGVLLDTTTKARIQFINEGGFGDGFAFVIDRYSIGDENIFTYCRKLCGGAIPYSTNEDALLSFVEKIAIREYPNLLLTIINNPFASRFNLNMTNRQEQDEFIKLVKGDTLNKLTNSQENLDYCFMFETTNKLSFSRQVCLACDIIISRAFQNCCNKMAYAIDDLLKEINNSINSLRSLSKNEEAIFSMFIGVQGVVFDKINSIDLSNCVFRALDSRGNPGTHSNSILTTHSEEGVSFISGGVIEIKYTTKVEHLGGNCGPALSQQLFLFANQCFENIRFALCFSLNEDYSFPHKFIENGFPLVMLGNYHPFGDYPKKYLKIAPGSIVDFKYWYQALSTVDRKHIQVPLARLKYAIYERDTPEDSIVDAIIAWESIFSSRTDTTRHVTNSIARFLKQENERAPFLRKLKNFYGLRSDLVHGRKNELSKEDREQIRSETIRIGLECLKKLISEPDLLKLKPEERVKKIMPTPNRVNMFFEYLRNKF